MLYLKKLMYTIVNCWACKRETQMKMETILIMQNYLDQCQHFGWLMNTSLCITLSPLKHISCLKINGSWELFHSQFQLLVLFKFTLYIVVLGVSFCVCKSAPGLWRFILKLEYYDILFRLNIYIKHSIISGLWLQLFCFVCWFFYANCLFTKWLTGVG